MFYAYYLIQMFPWAKRQWPGLWLWKEDPFTYVKVKFVA
jgi:hypothetical protein